MFSRIMQASTITLVLYALLGLNNTLQTNAARGETVEPAEVIVALKEVLARHQPDTGQPNTGQ